jgi:hypothetical protein
MLGLACHGAGEVQANDAENLKLLGVQALDVRGACTRYLWSDHVGPSCTELMYVMQTPRQGSSLIAQFVEVLCHGAGLGLFG